MQILASAMSTGLLKVFFACPLLFLVFQDLNIPTSPWLTFGSPSPLDRKFHNQPLARPPSPIQPNARTPSNPHFDNKIFFSPSRLIRIVSNTSKKRKKKKLCVTFHVSFRLFRCSHTRKFADRFFRVREASGKLSKPKKQSRPPKRVK